MKILLLADIHANFVALSAIKESFDACFFLGDAVEYGTDPAPCVDWIRTSSTAVVRGNHDHSTAQRVQSQGASPLRRLAAATRDINERLLTASHRKYLSQMPLTRSIDLDGKKFFLVHATPRDPMDEYLTDDPTSWQQRLSMIDADYVCVGHTHRPLHLDLGRTQVVNPGSVGQPRNGQPGAHYAVIEEGRIDFRTASYDIDLAVEQMRQVGLAEELVALSEHLLKTGGTLPTSFATTSPEPSPGL
jgi:putative phosphoesterase